LQDINNAYYNQNAQAFSYSTFSVDMLPLYSEFLPYISAGGHILDGGCGSARDAKAFKDSGFKVTAIDASEELVKIASQYLEQKVEHKTFQQIIETNTYDGIWCCASLLHVPHNELSQVFGKLSNALKQNGALYVSFKYCRDEHETNPEETTNPAIKSPEIKNPETTNLKITNLKINSQREHNGRFFTDLNEQNLNDLLADQKDLQLKKTWITGDKRAGREGEQWLNAIIIKKPKKTNDVDGASAANFQNQEQLSDDKRQKPVGEDFAYMDVGTRATQEQLPAALQNSDIDPVDGASAAFVLNQKQLPVALKNQNKAKQ